MWERRPNPPCSLREFVFNSKAQRAQGGKGLLFQSISVQESQKSINKALVLEKKEKSREKESHGREEGARPGGVGVLLVPGTMGERRWVRGI